MKVQQIQPFVFPGSDNGFLSIVKGVPVLGNVPENTEVPNCVAQGISVPGIFTQDIHLHIEANSRKAAQEALNGNKEGQNGDFTSDTYVDDLDMDIEPSNFVNLDKFTPKNLQQQLTTITIQGLPLLKKGSTERILQEFLGDLFEWSMMESDVVEKRPIFVRIATVKKVPSSICALETLAEVIEGVQIFADPKVDQYLEDPDQTSGEKKVPVEKKVLELVKRIASNPKNKLKSLRSGTEDLDQVMSYYLSYKVDPSELLDVPNDMKQTIVKDIIRFRSKVLEIERDRRKQEIEGEKKKAKQNLKRLFADIQEANCDDDSVDQEAKSDVSMDTDEVEFKDLDDAEYEKVLQRKRLEQRQLLLQREKVAFQNVESLERLKLFGKLEYLRDYENDLISNKARYIDQFMLISDSDDPKIKLYFNNFSDYLNIRMKEKAVEEKQDLLDEEKEAEAEAENSKKGSVVISTKSVPSTTKINIGSFNSEQLRKINCKIGDLFEEYLGLREDSLIEFVYQHLLDNNLDKKESLVEELVETLDDDAPIAVDELWKFIQQVSEKKVE